MSCLRTIRLFSQTQPSKKIHKFIPVRSVIGGLISSYSSVSSVSDYDSKHQKSNAPPTVSPNKYLGPLNPAHYGLKNLNLKGVEPVEEVFRLLRKNENDGFFKPPDAKTFVAIIRILCYWRMDMMLESLMLLLVQSDEKLLSEVSTALETELGLREGPNNYLFPRAVESLVKAFVSVGRFGKASFILLTSKYCGFLPSLSLYNFLMHQLLDCDELDKALNLLEEMERNGMTPYDSTYDFILTANAFLGLSHENDEIARSVRKNLDRCRALRNAQGGALAGLMMCENTQMRKRNIYREIEKEYVALKKEASGLGGSHDSGHQMSNGPFPEGGEFLEEAFQVFRQLKKSEQDGFFKPPDLETYVAIIRILCYWRMDNRLDSLMLEVIKSKKEHLGFDFWRLFLTLERRLNDIKEEEEDEEEEEEGSNYLLKRPLKVREEEEEGSNYLLARALDAMVKAFVTMDMFDEALLNLFMMDSSQFGLPLLSSCDILMDRLAECGKVDLALDYYMSESESESDDVYRYGIMMKALFRKGNVEETANLFWKTVKAGVIPINFTCIYVEELCSYGLPGRAEDVLRNMEELHGLIPDEYCYVALIDGYCQAGDPIRALDLLDEMRWKNIKIKINSVNATRILHCFGKLGKSEEALTLLNEMKDERMVPERNGMKTDDATYNNVHVPALAVAGGLSINGETLDA